MTNNDTVLAPASRYEKQVLFGGIGPEGQARLGAGRVALVGLGALGTVAAAQLARAGVGYLRLIDRDFVELGNLQRQTLFTEQDAHDRLPKVVAARRALAEANGTIDLDARLDDLTPRTAEALLDGVDLVIDGTDNLEARFLINDVCVKTGTPWIYGAALGSRGSTMVVVPGDTACLRCLMDAPPPPGTMRSCDTDGVIAMAPGVVASFQCAEALRLLTGLPPRRTLLNLDVWVREFQDVGIDRRPDCPACGQHRYEFLEGERASWTTVLCGRNSVQIMPPGEVEIPLEALGSRLSAIAEVTYNGFLLSVRLGEREIVVFPTGRAIIKGTTDEAEARTLYARYIGA
jgi:adenylyltransferase/sulfurtransferase